MHADAAATDARFSGRPNGNSTWEIQKDVSGTVERAMEYCEKAEKVLAENRVKEAMKHEAECVKASVTLRQATRNLKYQTAHSSRRCC